MDEIPTFLPENIWQTSKHNGKGPPETPTLCFAHCNHLRICSCSLGALVPQFSRAKALTGALLILLGKVRVLARGCITVGLIKSPQAMLICLSWTLLRTWQHYALFMNNRVTRHSGNGMLVIYFFFINKTSWLVVLQYKKQLIS